MDTQNFTGNCEFKSSHTKRLIQWLLSITEKKVPLIFLPLNQKYPHPLMNSDALHEGIQAIPVWARDHESNDAPGTILKT